MVKQKEMKTDYEKSTGISSFIILVLAITVIMVFLLCSCTKEPTPYEIASKGDSIEWDIQTHAYTQIIIDGWGTAQIAYNDSVFKMAAWNGNRNILGLPYDVWLYTDQTWGFVGSGIVRVHNDIILPG